MIIIINVIFICVNYKSVNIYKYNNTYESTNTDKYQIDKSTNTDDFKYHELNDLGISYSQYLEFSNVILDYSQKIKNAQLLLSHLSLIDNKSELELQEYKEKINNLELIEKNFSQFIVDNLALCMIYAKYENPPL